MALVSLYPKPSCPIFEAKSHFLREGPKIQTDFISNAHWQPFRTKAGTTYAWGGSGLQNTNTWPYRYTTGEEVWQGNRERGVVCQFWGEMKTAPSMTERKELLSGKKNISWTLPWQLGWNQIITKRWGDCTKLLVFKHELLRISYSSHTDHLGETGSLGSLRSPLLNNHSNLSELFFLLSSLDSGFWQLFF